MGAMAGPGHIFKLLHDDELNESFRVNVDFQENSFNLTILRKSYAWTTVVVEEIISSHAKQLEINSEEYFKNIQSYIKNAPINVQFSLINDVFVIKCKLKNNMIIQYFSCTLQQVDYNNCVENIMEKFYTERNNSLNRLVKVDAEKLELEKRNNILEVKLNEFIERKETDDQELYNCFVLELNEKKKRIQHLNELLEAFRRGRPTLNPPVEAKKRARKTEAITRNTIQPKEEISDSDPEGYNTDDEKYKITRNLSDADPPDDINRNKKITTTAPSTSNHDFFSDNSPPRHLLPKRIKSGTNESINFDKPCTSKQITKNDNSSAKNNNYKITNYEDVDDVNILQQTPEVNYNTQDLLDNIS